MGRLESFCSKLGMQYLMAELGTLVVMSCKPDGLDHWTLLMQMQTEDGSKQEAGIAVEGI